MTLCPTHNEPMIVVPEGLGQGQSLCCLRCMVETRGWTSRLFQPCFDPLFAARRHKTDSPGGAA